MDLKPFGLVVLTACSGNKANVVEDAAHAATPKPAAADAAPATPASGSGDVQVRVEWRDTPQVVRAPGPPTHCGSPRAPAVAPTTTWGVPDVFVTIDGLAPKPPSDARIVLADCDFAPRALVAGTTVTLASAMREPVRVTLAAPSKPSRTIYLPIAGHAVDIALDADTTYSLSYGADDIASIATGPMAVTDASGNVVLRGLAAGAHTVRAALPARNGVDARAATAQVTVTAGALAEVTVDLGRP